MLFIRFSNSDKEMNLCKISRLSTVLVFFLLFIKKTSIVKEIRRIIVLFNHEDVLYFCLF